MADNTLHPACCEIADLLAECEWKAVRRSGPGGQRRNKVFTGVVVTHVPTGQVAEASEARSSETNRNQAVFRLRMALAIDVRSEWVTTDGSPPPSNLWQRRCPNGRIHVGSTHDDFPAIIAEALDHFVACDADYKSAAEHLGCTQSQLRKLFEQNSAVMHAVHALRIAENRPRLKPT